MDLLQLYYKHQVKVFTNQLQQDKYLRIQTIYHEHPTTFLNRPKAIGQYLGVQPHYVRQIIASEGKYWKTKTKTKAKKQMNTIEIPSRITPEQFGLNERDFNRYVKGRALKIHSETQDFIYVLVDGFPHGIAREDLIPDDEYIIKKQQDWIEYLASKKEEIEELNKAA